APALPFATGSRRAASTPPTRTSALPTTESLAPAAATAAQGPPFAACQTVTPLYEAPRPHTAEARTADPRAELFLLLKGEVGELRAAFASFDDGVVRVLVADPVADAYRLVVVGHLLVRLLRVPRLRQVHRIVDPDVDLHRRRIRLAPHLDRLELIRVLR